jgi:enamine deaminase RidA (YjgF/YER057c/UK114 family)
MSVSRANPRGLHRFAGMSQVTEAADFVFIAGQVALTEGGELVGEEDVETQLRKVWANLELACNSVGGNLASLVKTTTFITAPGAFPAVAKVRTELFGDGGPANSTIIVAALARPEWLAEIEGVAFIGHEASRVRV